MRKPRVHAGKMVHAVLQSLFRKPATLNYPFEKPPAPEGLRGRLDLDPSKCIGCKLCMRDCPSGAITITKTGKTEITAVIDLAKCLYCGQCVESCPKNALKMTTDFELAELNREKLVIRFHRAEEENKSDEPGEDPGK